jgi:hypothetical protein
MQQLDAARAARLGEREEPGCHGRGRVHHRRQMRVVVFEDVRARPVEKRGVEHVAAFAAADNPRLRRAERRPQHTDRQAHRLVAAAAKRTADKVQ